MMVIWENTHNISLNKYGNIVATHDSVHHGVKKSSTTEQI